MKSLTALFMAAMGATLAYAGEKEARQAVQALAPEVKVVSVSKTPLPDLYEVVAEGPRGIVLVYASGNGDYVLLGELLDVKKRRSLTEERWAQLNAVDFDALPLDQAIKMVRGSGKRRLAVFSDPDCPYCRKLEPELAKLDDVTVYIFPYPLPIHPEASRKSKLVWCSKDRLKAWQDMMLSDRLPEDGRSDCDNPVDKNIALGQRLHINSTPTLIFSDGRRFAGYAPAERIEQMLASVQDSQRR